MQRGNYLMGGIAARGNCHSTRGKDGAFRPGMEMAGGFLLEERIMTAFAPNITPDRETGIGKWSGAEIKRAITAGVRADGSALSPPMGFGCYKTMTDDDLDALIAYLRSLKPVDHKVR